MDKVSQIQLNLTSILNVPFQAYDQFFFIVNGEKFETSRIIADLLSPSICQIHLLDRTFDTFIINTSHSGDFTYILNLAKFNQIDLPENEIPFISEVVEILNNSSIQYNDDNLKSEITEDNIFKRIQKHEYCSFFYKNIWPIEIDFISSHFFEFCEKYEEEFSNISADTLFIILNNDKLHLNSEDQLLQFINKLYSKDSKYSILYETVFFENVSTGMVQQFISLYNHNDMSRITWNRLSSRLINEIKTHESEVKSDLETENIRKIPRYGVTFEYFEQNVFKGILCYLQEQTKDYIKKIIEITSSSVFASYDPQNVIMYNQNQIFQSQCEKDCWICFDFKYHRVIPTNYTIKSCPGALSKFKLTNWVVEGSNDGNSWAILDEQKNCTFLRGGLITHTFSISKERSKDYRLIRLRKTNENTFFYTLRLSAFEIYGRLI